MSYPAGSPIVEYFAALDDDAALVSGETFTVVSALRPDGSSFVPVFTEVGSGTYKMTITTTAGEEGPWIVTAEGVLFPDRTYIFSYDVDAADVTPGAGRVTVVSPVAQDGTLLRLVRGDDYLNVDGRALEWTTTDAATWPTLTGASVALHLEGAAAAMAGTVVTPTGSAKKIRVELTDTMTAGFTVQRPLFQVVATLANADVVTLVAGRAQIAERITP